MAKKQAAKAEMLNEVQIAEINEIFTLFDKNADGLVATSELGTMIRGLDFNPTEKDVARF
jgi:calmodulin